MSKQTIVLSVGGSLVVPDQIDINFLKSFKKCILSFLKKYNFIIVVGGGRTSRLYASSAKLVSNNLTQDDRDWLGIHATILNAHLLRSIFKKYASEEIITNPTKLINRNLKPIRIGSGWKPGCSTDYDAVLLAKKVRAKILVNLTDVDYVYTKNPKKFKSAKPIKQFSWSDFIKLVGTKWDPGLHAPFDPVASVLAKKLHLKVLIMNGKNIKNLANFLNSRPFKGTVIQ